MAILLKRMAAGAHTCSNNRRFHGVENMVLVLIHKPDKGKGVVVFNHAQAIIIPVNFHV